MLKSILKRILYMLIVVWVVSVMSFVLMRCAPGDPTATMLPDTATEEQRQALYEQLGLDQPYVVQYFRYLGGLLTGDLGHSTLYNSPVADVIAQRLPATICVSLISAVFVLLISVPIGVLSGVTRGSMVDFSLMFFVVILQSMSVVWVCVLLLLIFVIKLDILPSMGYYGLSKPSYLIMPIIAMGYRMCAQVARMGRSSMIDVLNEDYITCAYARGLSKREVYSKYALRNSMIPVITIYGLQVAAMLSGAVVVEQIFSIPGIGTMLVTAVNNRDYPLVQSTLVVTAAMFSLVNLIVDIAITFIDPRIREV
ncbi:ABC transporter permease [Flavonifractor sp. DFI.6.63]|uniref:ABC transporter permease n=1 Tax=Flavonifractor sp. DFI.6.63 TaxID=2963704 RepID=UPI002109B609|nr:ABC transporter permease [Flavonifractor sp. DFI.6.63]MCQ5028319.1 ABC transporter permease [Flavonifractor sp. DFI.6.63]